MGRIRRQGNPRGRFTTGGYADENVAENEGRDMKIDKSNRVLRATIKERLEFYSKKDLETGCVNWTSGVDRYGYGRISISRKRRLVHRIAYEEIHGPISRQVLVLHKCDNRTCINIEHLFLGTQQENLADMYRKGRENLCGLRHAKTPKIMIAAKLQELEQEK